VDELQLIRDFFGAPPPPDPDIAAAAKARMSAPGPAVRHRFARGLLAARPNGLRLRLGIPVVAAAAAVAVVAAVLVQGAPQVSPERGGIGVFQLPGAAAIGGPAGPARGILLTAARTAAKAQQAAPERYYVTPATVGNVLRVGPPADRYLVLEVVGTQDWAATNPRDGSPQLSQALYVQAASPADKAAWRRDGSPRVWQHVGQDTSLADPVGATDGWLRPLSAAPGKLAAGGAVYGAQPFILGNRFLSLRQLQALPADPAKLKAILLGGWSAHGSVGTATSYLFQTVPSVLEMPVTPAVRSALYKLLASLPGVQSMGPITDVAGRQGVAVAYSARYSGCGRQSDPTSSSSPAPLFSSCTVQQVLIIGPADGIPLAEELRYTQLPAGQHWSAPDGLFSYEIFGTPYWTNRDRPLP
jgi:hypothetical protein